ncbi:MAG: TSUP family transporter [Actinobacteria bacterium]|jgi:hypothetical protein|nr:hypothetical protein [Actinomycetota bacterium]NCG39975.1 TSUP family transporter [Actinomycetota bacterium]
MTFIEYWIALLLLIIGCTVQACLGIGAGLIAGPVLVAIEPELLPGPMLCMSMVVSIRNTIGDWHETDSVGWRRAVIGAPAGIAFGLILLSKLSESALTIAISLFVIGAVVIQLIGIRLPKGRGIQYLAGAATAFSATVAAIPGPVFAIFYGHRKPGTMRGTVARLMLLLAPMIITPLIISGAFGWYHTRLSLFLLPSAFLGLAFGAKLRPHLNGKWFKTAILGVASASALGMIFRELV